jgi:hypothetical protein
MSQLALTPVKAVPDLVSAAGPNATRSFLEFSVATMRH